MVHEMCRMGIAEVDVNTRLIRVQLYSKYKKRPKDSRDDPEFANLYIKYDLTFKEKARQKNYGVN